MKNIKPGTSSITKEVLFISLDRSFKYVEASAHYKKRFKQNFKKEWKAGIPISEYYAPEPGMENLKDQLKPVLEGETVSIERKILEEEQLRIYKYSFIPSFSPEGEVSGVSAIINEVTPGKNIEENLYWQNIMFRSLIENSSDIFCLIDTYGNYLYMAPSVEKVLGYKPEFFHKKNAFEFVHPEDQEIVMERLTALVETGEDAKVSFRFKAADGSWRWLESLGSNELLNPSVGGIVVASRDISEAKKHEEEIAFQAHLLNMAGESIVATNLEGEIIFWNNFATKLYGWEKEEALGKKLLDVIPSSQSIEEASEIMDHLTKGKRWSGEFPVKNKAGREFMVKAVSEPVKGPEGTIIGIVGITSDISKEERLKKILLCEKEVFEMASKNQPVENLIEMLMKNMQELSKDAMICSFMQYDRENQVLHNLISSDLPHEFTEKLKEVPVRYGSGSCGTAAFLKKTVFVESIEDNDFWGTFRNDALKAGLKACTSFPVLSSELELFGTFTCYFRMPQAISADDLELLERGVNICSILMEKHFHEVNSRKNQQLFNEISASIPGVVYQLTRNSKGKYSVNFISESIFETFGYHAEDIRADINNFYSIIHPADIDRVLEYSEQTAGTLEPSSLKYRIFSGKDNSIIWLRSHSIPSMKENGDVVWNGTMLDITEAEMAVKEIARSEEKFRSIVENTPDMILQVDREGHILFINYALPGYDKEGALGVNVFDYMPAEECLKVKAVFKKVFEEGSRDSFESCAIVEENNIYFHSRVGPLYDGEEIVAATIITTDITKMISVQEEVKRNKEELQMLLSNLPDIVARINPELKYLYMNEAISRHTTRTPDFYIGKTNEEINKDPAFAEKFNPALKEVFATGETRNVELAYTTKGKRKVFETTIVPEMVQGQTCTVLVISRDVSDKKLFEERLSAQNNELRKVNEELDRFVYSASHDLRSPLTSILGLLNLAKLEEKSEEMENYHLMIEESIRRLDEVVKDIIDYSRNARTQVKPTEIDFPALFENIIKSFRFSKEAEGIEFISNIESTKGFKTDDKRLKIVLENLISNAIKYSDKNKTGSFVKIDLKQNKGKVEFSIEDNGIGIEDEYQEKLFNMFFRATSQSTGSGLGLFIVKEAVEKLGGKIKLESKFNHGTRFIVELPGMDLVD